MMNVSTARTTSRRTWSSLSSAFANGALLGGALTSVYDGAGLDGRFCPDRSMRPGANSLDVPAKGCSCGVYAYYDPCPRTASAATPDLIGGAVVVWGRIEAHIYGMRGEHARIVALELPFSRGEAARRGRAAESSGGRRASHLLKAVALEHGEVLPPSQAKEDIDPRRQRVVSVRAGLIMLIVGPVTGGCAMIAAA